VKETKKSEKNRREIIVCVITFLGLNPEFDPQLEIFQLGFSGLDLIRLNFAAFWKCQRECVRERERSCWL